MGGTIRACEELMRVVGTALKLRGGRVTKVGDGGKADSQVTNSREKNPNTNQLPTTRGCLGPLVG